MIIKDHTRIDLAQGGTRFKQGDFVELAFTPRDAAGKVVDLTGKQIEASIWNRSKGVIYQGAASFDSAEKLIRVTIKETLDHGKFQIEFTVTDSTDADYRRKFPSDEYNGVINITPSTDNMDVVGVQMTTVTQLRNEQQQLQQEFESQVLPRVDTVEDKQTQLEADYQAAAGALTEDSEVILARKGEPTLRAFNDKVVAQLADKVGGQRKLKPEELSDEAMALVTGNGTVNVLSEPQDESVTGAKIADDGLEYIYRQNAMPILEEQQKGVLSKITGLTNGIYNLSSAHADSATLSYVDNLTSPVKQALKNVKVTHVNATDLYKSFFVFFPITVTEVNKPYANGYWIKKDFFANMADEIFSPIVWFYNDSTLVENISFNITDKTLIKPGYKNSVTKNGITFNFAITKEFGEWFFIEQRVNVLAATTNKLEFGLFVQKSKPQATTTLEISNFSVLENQTFALPQLDYIKETASADSRKTVNYGYNFDKPLGLLKWRAALAKRQSAIARVAVIGDSISEGYWSGLNHERAYPVLMRKALQARYGGQDEGFVTVNDVERFVTSGTWVNGSGGMASRRKTSVVAGSKITFTFTGVAVDVIYSKNTDGGTCAVKIDGVDKTAINCNGTSEVYAQTQSYTGLAAGSHILEIFAPTDGTKVYVEGAYVKTVGDTAGVQVERRAKSGGYTGDWTSQLMLNTFTTKPADLFIIALGINDLGSTQTIANFKSRMQTIITATKAVGSVVIVPMMQPDPVADTRFVAWKDWVQVYYDLADENNIPLIDIYKAYGEAYQPAQSFGLFGIQNGNGEGTDTTHPSARGQMLISDVNVKLIG